MSTDITTVGANGPANPLPQTTSQPEATPPKAPDTKPEQFFASIKPGLDSPLPDSCKTFCRAVLEYEKITKQPALVVLQNDATFDDIDSITSELADAIIDSKEQIEAGKELNLILHTLGGDPSAGYKLSIFLQKRTGGFNVVIPKMAKSAGTLIALAANRMIMGEMAELGPLDMQVRDPESDLWDSALNETKSLQTLSREALVLYAEKMQLLGNLHGGKRFETRNRIATDFVNEMIRPLVEKIDAVHYTKMARIMEIMKMYGKQLMKRAGYPPKRLAAVVQSLGEDYPDHGYIIDAREARALGLRVETPKGDKGVCVETMSKLCGNITMIGRISSSHETKTSTA